MNTSVLFIVLAIGAVIADDTMNTIDSLMAEVIAIEEQDLKNCVRNGDTTALESAKSAGAKFLTCLKPMRKNRFALLSSIGANPLGDKMEEVKELCTTVKSIYPTCHKNYIREVKPCLSDQDVTALELYHSILESIYRSNCKDDGKDIAAAFQVGEMICLKDHVDSLENCMAPLVKEGKQNGNSTLAFARSLMGKGCNVYKNMLPCIEKNLPCLYYRRVLMDGMNAANDILTPCPQYTDAPIQEVQASSPTLSKDRQAEEINILRCIQVLLQEIAETNQRQLDLQKGMDERDKLGHLKQEKTFKDVTGILSKILHALQQ